MTDTEQNKLKIEDHARLDKEKKEKDDLELEELKKFPPVGYCKLQYTLADWIDITFILLSFLGALAMGVSFPLFAIIFGDSITSFGNTSTVNMSDTIRELSIKLIYIGLGMFGGAFLNVTFSSIVGDRYGKKIKFEYFKALLRQEQGFFDQRNAFEFSTKVQAQLKTVNSGLGSKVSNALMSVSMFVSAYVVGFIVSWKLSLILLSVVPFMTIGGYCMIKALMESQAKTRQYFEQAGGIAEEILYNIKTVASFSNFQYERDRFNEKLEYSYEKGKFGGMISSLSRAIVFFFIFGSYAIAIGVGAKFIATGETNKPDGTPFQVGDIITVIFTIVFGSFSLGQSAPNLKAIAAACDASREFFFLYDRKPETDLTLSVEKPSRDSLEGQVSFKNVTFAYPSKLERKILDDLNIEFKKGESTAIVGETGSGKSTIVNLLERLYDAQSGEIEIDGINIRRIDLEYYRSLIGYVPQEPVLFNTSIRENIIFGRENVTEEEIKEACEKACVTEFLVRLEKGLDTRVGIKGSKLSGGQKQRVAIARAILKKPKLLFLDEATSALDNKSEVLVKKALDIASEGVTTIIIAHRLSTVRNANTIIVLNNGVIAEKGTHVELFESKGLYYNLVKSQEINKEDRPEVNEEEMDMGENKLNNSNPELKKKDSKLALKDIPEEELTLEQRKQLILEAEKENERDIKEAKKILWPIMCENPGTLVTATLMACVSGVVWPVYGLLLAEAIFRLSNNPANPRTTDQFIDDGVFLAGMFVIIACVAGISNFFVGNLFSLMGEHLAKSMRKKCFDKYLSLHMSFYDHTDNNPGALLTKLAGDTIKINGVALSMFAVICETLVTLIIGIVLALVYSWQLALICLAFVPFIIITAAMNLRVQKGFAINDEIKEKDMGNLLSECVVNTKTIYCFNMQVKAVEMFKELANTGNSGTITYLLMGLITGLSQLIMFVVYAVTFYVGALLVEDLQITYDNMFRAIFTILFAAFGVGMVDQYLGDMSEAKKSLVSLFKVLSIQSEINPEVEGKFKPNRDSFKGEVEFKNVTFSYPTRQNTKIFKNLSFKIEAGTQNAFVGFSGSGKSTIVQLLLRFYDVQSGEILIDGINIKDYDIITLRHLMGLVMQEPVLFKTNVYNNILYGKLTGSNEEIIDCSTKAKVPRIEQITKDNKDALPVSGGEKQRIAIARCMLRDPKILLLDEATSALDKNVEEIVQKALDELMMGRTSVVIAHRLSTIINCNKIFLLEHGQIVESGSHTELIELKGRYYSLYHSGKKQ